MQMTIREIERKLKIPYTAAQGLMTILTIKGKAYRSGQTKKETVSKGRGSSIMVVPETVTINLRTGAIIAERPTVELPPEPQIEDEAEETTTVTNHISQLVESKTEEAVEPPFDEEDVTADENGVFSLTSAETMVG